MSSLVAVRSTRLSAPTRAQRRELRSRSRAVAWAEIVALVLIAIALVVATVATSRHSVATVRSERVRIESGQTLWNLASLHPVAGQTTEQTAELIASINHIKSGRVVAGTTLRIPSQPADNVAVACR